MVNTRWKVSRAIDTIASLPINSFGVGLVASITDLSAHEVLAPLIHLVEDGILNVKWELRCPRFECDQVITLPDSVRWPALDLYCEYCGHSFDADIQDLYPVFSLTDEYRQVASDLSKKKHLLDYLVRR